MPDFPAPDVPTPDVSTPDVLAPHVPAPDFPTVVAACHLAQRQFTTTSSATI